MSLEPTLSSLQALIISGQSDSLKRSQKLELQMAALAQGLTTANQEIAYLKKTKDSAENVARKAMASVDDLEGVVTREVSAIQRAMTDQDVEIAEIKRLTLAHDAPLALLVKESTERTAQLRLIKYLVAGSPVVIGALFWVFTHFRF